MMRDESGFTLIEVLVSMALMGVLVLGLQAAVTGRFVAEVHEQDVQAAANQVAHDRLEQVRMHPEYASLEDEFDEAEVPVPGRPGFALTTDVVRARAGPGACWVQRPVQARQLDFTTVTVTVSARTLEEPVRRTIVVGAP